MRGTWDTTKGSELARRAYAYVAATMPPDAHLDVLGEHEDAAIRAQRAGDLSVYEEALRQMCRTAKREAVRRRRAA
jgi:hypothetical protein